MTVGAALADTNQIRTNARVNSFDANRISIAVLGFPRKGNSGADPLSIALESSIVAQLRAIPELRVTPGLDPIAYTLWENGLPGTLNWKELQARGVSVAAEWVLHGECERAGNKISVSAELRNVKTGQSPTRIQASSEDLAKLQRELTREILRCFGIRPTDAERLNMEQCWSGSSEALEFLATALSNHSQNKPFIDVESPLKRAIEVDPAFCEAYYFLASELDHVGKADEAVALAKKVTSTKPSFASSYITLGIHSWHLGKYEEAESLLEKASRLDRDNSQTFTYIAQVRRLSGKFSSAAEACERAVFLNPQSALIRANLAYIRLLEGRPELAREEAAKASNLPPAANSEGFEAECLICETYCDLGDGAAAVMQYQKFADLPFLLSESAMDNIVVNWVQGMRDRCKSKLPPTLLNYEHPKTIGPIEFTKLIHQRLSPYEGSTVVNPLESSAQMREWAQKITEDKVTSLVRARKLYDALAERAYECPFRSSHPLTAQETYARWNTSSNSFRCQEIAYLYTALARCVGLDAYFAFVEKAWDGSSDYHACSVVFVEGKAVLVDPSYWFGVPHQKVMVLDDLQSAALHLAGRASQNACQTAVKLAPNLPSVHQGLFQALLEDGKQEEARKEAAILAQLHPDGALTYFAKAELALVDQKPDEAIDLLREASKRAPFRDVIYRKLGEIYAVQGKKNEAREAFRRATRCPQSEEAAHTLQEDISKLKL